MKAPTPVCWTVPETVDKEKKNPVVDKSSLRGLAPEFNRGEDVFEGNTLKIVEIDILRNAQIDFVACRKARLVQAFCLQGSEEIFHRRIFINTAGSGPGWRNVVLFVKSENAWDVY